MSSTVQARPAPARNAKRALQARQAREAGRKAMAARQWAKALPHFERAAELLPDAADSWLDLMELGLHMGEPARAERATRRLLELVPGHAQAHRLLLRCLELQGDWLGLIAASEQLPPAMPRDMELLEKLGAALFRAHRPQDAVQIFIETLRIQPRHAGTHYRLGLALKMLEMDAQSAISFETASLLDADGKAGFGGLAQSLLVHQLGRLVRWQDLAPQSAALLRRVDQKAEAIPPFALLALPATAQQQLDVGRLEVRRLTLGQTRLPALPARAADPASASASAAGGARRLRLGLLSSDFFNHATVTLLVELLELLD
ncbi:MAG: tetratricopeptide repeat protein, partial [Burkholderiaceae bacterium]